MADGSDHHSDHHRRSRFWTSSCSHFGFGTRRRETLPRGRRRTSGAPRNRHRCRTWRRVYYRKAKGVVIERVGRVRNNVLEGPAKSESDVFAGIHFLGTDFTAKPTAHFARPLFRLRPDNQIIKGSRSIRCCTLAYIVGDKTQYIKLIHGVLVHDNSIKKSS